LQCSAGGKKDAGAGKKGAVKTKTVATGVKVTDIPKGTMKEVTVDGIKGGILLCHLSNGTVTATSSKCP
jgi:nitrite reductase/ring-hydroxylating ferredoxin subunit